MSGTKAGGKKARDTNLARNPNFYGTIGKIGGQNGTGHKFAHGRVDPSVAGVKGGTISKRGPSKPKVIPQQWMDIK